MWDPFTRALKEKPIKKAKARNTRLMTCAHLAALDEGGPEKGKPIQRVSLPSERFGIPRLSGADLRKNRGDYTPVYALPEGTFAPQDIPSNPARYRQRWAGTVRGKDWPGDVADPTGEAAIGDLEAAIDALEDDALATDAPEVEPEEATPDTAVVEAYDEEYDEEFDQDKSGYAHNPERLLETMRWLLNDRELEVAQLVYGEGLTNAQAAERLPIGLDRVAKIVSKVRNKLQAVTDLEVQMRNRGTPRKTAA
jgi:DNA-directed RNA polymerase specialized sigma24 family protein